MLLTYWDYANFNISVIIFHSTTNYWHCTNIYIRAFTFPVAPLLFVWVLHFQLRCCLYFRVSFTFPVEVLLLLFVWVLPFQCDSACDLYSPYCDFKLLWSLRFECISISCCYAARILTCKAGVATAIVLYRSRFRNGSVWVLQRKWLLFQIGCLVMDP